MLLIFYEVSPNTLQRINSPPHAEPIPRRGDVAAHERFLTAVSFSVRIFGNFRKKR